MRTDPSPLPLQPAILSLIHKRRKAVYNSFTTNARGRGAMLASSIRNRDEAARQHLRNLPPGGDEDFVILATSIGIDRKQADDKIAALNRKFERDGFKLFGGARSAQPKVSLNGRRMSIVEAIEESGCKENYQTVYRRIQRGWSVKEALGLTERT